MLNDNPPKTCKLCQYVKSDGRLCASPALRNQRFCYHHDQWRQQEDALAKMRAITLTRAELRLLHERLAEMILKSPGFKNLLVSIFEGNIMRQTRGLTGGRSVLNKKKFF
jgi:hypothetical protein